MKKQHIVKALGVLPVVAFISFVSMACYGPGYNGGYSSSRAPSHDASEQVKPPRVTVSPILVNPNVPIP